MDLRKWVLVSVGFSFMAFIAYGMVSWIQKMIFEKLAQWNMLLELGMYVLFYGIYTIITYAYYSSPIIEGFYTFQEFFLKIAINIFLIITPIIIISRRYVIHLIPNKKEDIIIKGNNKLDFLKIKQSELVCISNIQNYVEIFFLENGELKTKLIRSSLKQIQADFDFLIQVHRSHLINPAHFKSWKNSSTILLTQKELPVSKTYKNNLLAV